MAAAACYGVLSFLLGLLVWAGIFPAKIFLLYLIYVVSFVIITKATNIAAIYGAPVLVYLIGIFSFPRAFFLSGCAILLLCFLFFRSLYQFRKKKIFGEVKFSACPQPIKLVRKILRFWAVLIPLVYLCTSRGVALIFVGILAGVFLFFELLRRKFPAFAKNKVLNILLKAQERQRVSGITWFTVSSFLVVFFFSEKAAICALFFAIFGDLLAELVGKRFGRIKLPGGRTLEGTVMFFMTCVTIGLALKNSYHFSFQAIIITSAMTSLGELVSGKIGHFSLDDNLTVPIIAALMLSSL